MRRTVQSVFFINLKNSEALELYRQSTDVQRHREVRSYVIFPESLRITADTHFHSCPSLHTQRAKQQRPHAHKQASEDSTQPHLKKKLVRVTQRQQHQQVPAGYYPDPNVKVVPTSQVALHTGGSPTTTSRHTKQMKCVWMSLQYVV